jgi:hypothetical protein
MLFKEIIADIVRTIHNIQIHCVGRLQNFNVLKQVVCITAVLYKIKHLYGGIDPRIFNLGARRV